MKSIFTIGRKHGSDKWEVLLDNTATFRQQRLFAKTYRANRKHPTHAEIQTVVAVRKFKFEPLTEPKREAKPKPTLAQKIVLAVTPKPKAKRPGRKPASTAFAKRIAAANATTATT